MTDPNIPIPPVGTVTKTTTEKVSVEPAKPPPSSFSRKVEDGGLLICVVMFGLWMLTAVMKNAGYIVGPCKNLSSGFPWEFLVSGAMLALPKIVGRATAGRVWEKLAGRGGGAPPSETP